MPQAALSKNQDWTWWASGKEKITQGNKHPDGQTERLAGPLSECLCYVHGVAKFGVVLWDYLLLQKKRYVYNGKEKSQFYKIKHKTW